MLSEFATDVLDLVQRIPPGRVMTYGDVARALGRGGPRQVGTTLARFGSDVPWWRVLRASGLPPTGCEGEALSHYRDESTPLVAGTGSVRVDLGSARWMPMP